MHASQPHTHTHTHKKESWRLSGLNTAGDDGNACVRARGCVHRQCTVLRVFSYAILCSICSGVSSTTVSSARATIHPIIVRSAGPSQQRGATSRITPVSVRTQKEKNTGPDRTTIATHAEPAIASAVRLTHVDDDSGATSWYDLRAKENKILRLNEDVVHSALLRLGLSSQGGDGGQQVGDAASSRWRSDAARAAWRSARSDSSC